MNDTIAFFHRDKTEIAQLISNLSLNERINYLCHIEGDTLVLDYRFFKSVAVPETLAYLMQLVIDNIHSILREYPLYNVCICMKSLTVSDVDRYKNFIFEFATRLKTEFQDKMNKCYIYRAPYVFEKVYSIVSCVIDKPTRQKIIVVENNLKK